MADLKLSAKAADALLDKLSSDDKFRDLFKKDTAAALKQVGAPPEAAGCCNPKKLPSKDAIKKARDVLRSQLTSKLAQVVFQLDT